MNDNTDEALEVQRRMWRSMSMTQKMKIIDELSEAARDLSMAGIRSRHPKYTDQEVRWALWRMLYGDDLFQRAWPAAPLLAP